MSARDDARTNETARQTRTERELARLEAQEQGEKTAAKKKKKKVKEKTSTRNTSNDAINAGAERLMQPMRIQLREAVLRKNKKQADSLRKRLLAVQSTKI